MISKTDLKKLLPFLRIGFSFFLIIFLLKRFDIDIIYQNIKKTKWEFLVYAVFLNLIGDALSSLQWKAVLSVHRINVKFKKLFSYYLIGAFFNNFFPTSIGGDVYKMHRLRAEKISVKHAVTSVAMTRIMGLWTLLIIATAASFAPINLKITGPDIISVFLILWLASLILFFMPQIFIRELSDIARCYKNEKGRVFAALAVSFFAQILGIIFCILVSGSLNLNLTISQIAYFSSLTIIFSALPFAINGLGIREGSYVWLFNKAGVGGEAALSFSFLIAFLMIFRSIVGGILYATSKEWF